MRKIILLNLLLLKAAFVLAQGISFSEGSFKEIQNLAKERDKLIFVDVYTDWCGPCKKMSKDIFPLSEVGNFYNERFVNYKLNAEKGEGPELAKKWGIMGYPTFVFLDYSGKVIYSIAGSVDKDKFIEFGKTVSFFNKYGGRDKIDEMVKSGSDNYEFLKEYYEFADTRSKKSIYAKLLLSMPDSVLFALETGEMINKDLIYDRSLMDRLTIGLADRSNRDGNYIFSYTFPVVRKISLFFEDAIAKEDLEMFNQLVEQKKRIAKLPQASDKDENLIDGRGIGFGSEELLRLSFLSETQDDEDSFKSILVPYMEGQLVNAPVNTLVAKLADRFKLYSALHSGSEKSNKESTVSQLVGDDLFNRHSIYSKLICKWINYYWLISPSDKTIKKQCANWALYAYNINPYNYESLIQVSNILVKLGEPKKAIEIIKNYLAMSDNLNLKKKVERRIKNLLLMISKKKYY